MYFYKRGQFQAVGIRANNLGYRPRFKILLIELFLKAGNFDIFRILPNFLVYIKFVSRLAFPINVFFMANLRNINLKFQVFMYNLHF
jgi:hypothetical protein